MNRKILLTTMLAGLALAVTLPAQADGKHGEGHHARHDHGAEHAGRYRPAHRDGAHHHARRRHHAGRHVHRYAHGHRHGHWSTHAWHDGHRIIIHERHVPAYHIVPHARIHIDYLF